MKEGLVSTIIPVYNRASLLREAVQSVLAQTYRPLEILVVDDGSTDDTREAARALSHSQEEVRLLVRENGGPGAARETGRLAAQGEFIQHLDSDDVLLPRKFELQVAALRAHPDSGAAYGWTRLRDRDGNATGHPSRRTGERIETMFPAMLQMRWWETASPLYRSSLIDAAGPWTTLRVEEDWEYDARIAAQGVRVEYCAEWVCEHRDLAGDRLSRHGLEAWQLRDRARAHALIYGHGRRAAIPLSSPEMQHFARELFLLARQCGAAGLPAESKELFELAREASGPLGRRPAFRGYFAATRLLGWSLTGKISCLSDKLRW